MFGKRMLDGIKVCLSVSYNRTAHPSKEKAKEQTAVAFGTGFVLQYQKMDFCVRMNFLKSVAQQGRMCPYAQSIPAACNDDGVVLCTCTGGKLFGPGCR
jgi:hypothetical protein